MHPCLHCDKATYWTYADPEMRPAAYPPFADMAPPLPDLRTKLIVNRRAHGRVPMQMSIHLRTEDGQEEASITENVAIGGFACILGMELKVAQIVTFICPYIPNGQNIEGRAECRWSAPVTSGGATRIYGFRYVR